MTTLISDLSKLGFTVALCAITVLALALSIITLASLAVVSMPFLMLAAPTIITLLCLYATYQCMYPTLAPIPMDDSAQWERYTAFDSPLSTYDPSCEDNEDYLVIEECATSEEYHAQFSHHDTTPVCSITYALLATTGTDDVTYLTPAFIAPVTVQATEDEPTMDTTPTIRSSCNLDHYSHDALVSLAKELKIKGANSRWTDATLIRKIEERTLLIASAA
jgi:hypothetical protein